VSPRSPSRRATRTPDPSARVVPVERARRAALAAVSIVASCLVLGLPGGARAYEDEIDLGVAAGYAWNVAREGREVGRHGAGVSLTVAGGLNDVLTLQGHVGYSAHPDETATTHVLLGGIELVYLLDVLEFVPFFGLGVDALGSVLSGDGNVELGAHALLGLDWLISYEGLVGVDVRLFLLPLTIDEPRLEPLYGQVLIRASRRFDIF